MKRFLAIIMLLAMVLSMTACGGQTAAAPEETPAAEEAPVAEEAAETEAAVEEEAVVEEDTFVLPDPQRYKDAFAKYAPDTLVMKMGEKEITWDEYFYYLYQQVYSLENYIGVVKDWDQVFDSSTGTTYQQALIEYTNSNLALAAAVEAYANEEKLELTEDDIKTLNDSLATGVLNAVGAEYDSEEGKAFLEEQFLTPELYVKIMAPQLLLSNLFVEKYGENCEKVTDEQVEDYLEDNGYIRANHILVLTKDMATGEDLSEEQIAEAKEKADKLYAELKKVKGNEKLEAKFKELKEENCEDSGKTAFPDGYVFKEGTMVTEFYETANSLELYGLSEPVKTAYGYHIILRLPHDRTILLSDANATPDTMVANDDFTAIVEGYLKDQLPEYTEEFENLKMADLFA